MLNQFKLITFAAVFDDLEQIVSGTKPKWTIDGYPAISLIAKYFPRRLIAALHRICREGLENLTIATKCGPLMVQRRPPSGHCLAKYFTKK